MPLSLSQIKAPIALELEVFEKKFRESMKSRVALLDVIMNYIVKRKGKQMRPIFVLLSARLFGPITDKTYRGAALVELLHTATLVHDDVVDVSFTRRGFFSINALWKNKIAVLVGDYLLSKGLLLALKNGDHDLLTILSEAVEAMSEGELLQLEKARRLDITEDVYFDIISKKTASLIGSCCAIGASASGASALQINLMREFGMKAGIAFQIKDDLFDYGNDDIGIYHNGVGAIRLRHNQTFLRRVLHAVAVECLRRKLTACPDFVRQFSAWHQALPGLTVVVHRGELLHALYVLITQAHVR